MKKTLIVYGSASGTCQGIAEQIAQKLGVSDVVSAADVNADKFAEYDNLLLGTSTWGAGDLQDDWYDALEELKKVNLTGKTVAVFGCGDSASFSDTFCGGMAELYNTAKAAGATMVGEVSTDGYTFDDSAAVENGKFVGLALDEVNEPDQTEGRIDAWVAAIKDKL